MEKEENYSANFTGLDYSLDHHHHHQDQDQLIMNSKETRIVETSGDDHNTSHGEINDYMLNNPHHQQQHQISSSGFCTNPAASLDKLSFADHVMQFADFGPKLALNQTCRIPEEDLSGYFLRFPVLNDKLTLEDQTLIGIEHVENSDRLMVEERVNINREDDQEARVSDNASVQLQFQKQNPIPEAAKNKRKRPRTIKTSEEVESQRMTHIAVERNRRKQMNENLRVLRSLMPGSYVQRGDQASIIGGAIEFVRELEQLLQCLESHKRRRLYGEASMQMGDTSMAIQQQQLNYDSGLCEETAENKSCLADVEVKLLGFDATIKILSRRRPGQLVKTIDALEDLQLSILHTNITTIERTVLYSFNVKVASESRFSAEDIASSVQQIFTSIHANSSM